MSSITPMEQLLKSEIHIYKKRTRDKLEAIVPALANILIKVNELGPNFIRQLAEKRLPSITMGWQMFDVTPYLESCITPRKAPPRLLALSFHVEDDAKVYDFPLHEFVRLLSRPYLINFSNDTQSISLDHIDPHLMIQGSMDQEAFLVNPENGQLEDLDEGYVINKKKRRSKHRRHRKHRKPEQDLDELGTLDSSNAVVGKPLTSVEIEPFQNENTRWKRSIFDNEIPEDTGEAVEPPSLYNVPKTNPDILTGRGHSQRREPPSSKVIPYPDEASEEKGNKKDKSKHGKRRKNRRKHGKGQKNEPFRDDQWEEERDPDDPPGAKVSRGRGVCDMKTLVIDFADIGWNEWIISPMSFEANVCVGSCPFPKAKVSSLL